MPRPANTTCILIAPFWILQNHFGKNHLNRIEFDVSQNCFVEEGVEAAEKDPQEEAQVDGHEVDQVRVEPGRRCTGVWVQAP